MLALFENSLSRRMLWGACGTDKNTLNAAFIIVFGDFSIVREELDSKGDGDCIARSY